MRVKPARGGAGRSAGPEAAGQRVAQKESSRTFLDTTFLLHDSICFIFWVFIMTGQNFVKIQSPNRYITIFTEFSKRDILPTSKLNKTCPKGTKVRLI